MNRFPESLKRWRLARRFSQLQLSVEADVSSRHISFLETGRAKPSREMIDRLGDALNLPLSTRNQMLTHAGFAVRYPSRNWDADEMAPIRDALKYTLEGHEPYPAFAVNRVWSVMKMNRTAEKLFGILGLMEGSSLLELVLSDIFPNYVENWEEVAHHSAQRLRTESLSQGGVPELDQAAEHLSKVPLKYEIATTPVIPTIYRAGKHRFALFSTISQFGTPADLTLDDLKIELFFPADSETKNLLYQMDNS